MIICFSGTGNSLLVARQLQGHLGGDILQLEGERLLDPTAQVINIAAGENVVWVFPVYSWGVPPVVVAFMRRCKLIEQPGTLHYLVCTCGDDIGMADHQWSKIAGRRGFTPRAAFSVTMPNTYVNMKGFDVDTPETAQRKLDAMPERVGAIADAMRRGFGGADVVRGKWAWLKSAIVYPVFCMFYMSPKPFHATDCCTRCGLCEKSCPMNNITQLPPAWGGNCAMCLRCYHICPHHAVAYGKETGGKGQKRVFSQRLSAD